MATPRGHFSRSRSLEDMNRKLGNIAVEKMISKIIRSDGKKRLLEIGCGEGRVLLQLLKLFPSLELHGINKKPWPAMKGQESLAQAARFYSIFTKKELSRVFLPKIHFCDAEKLPFLKNHFDIIISQVSFHYIRRKDWALEEIWRVLKVGGIAKLHIDNWGEGSPDFLSTKNPRWTIYRNGKRVTLQAFFASFRRKGFDIRYKIHKHHCVLTVKKNTSKPLKLGLEFDEVASFDLAFLNHKWTFHTDIFWGYRSVFRIK